MKPADQTREIRIAIAGRLEALNTSHPCGLRNPLFLCASRGVNPHDKRRKSFGH